MFWRTLAGLAMVLTTVPTVAAKTYLLSEPLRQGDCFRLRLTMQLKGEMRFQGSGKTLRLGVRIGGGL